MNEKLTGLKVTSRVQKLLNDLAGVERELCTERISLITESYKETEGEPIIIRRAKGLKKVLENMTVRIYDGELIVGNQASNRRFGPLYPEMAWKWIEDELDTLPKRAESFQVPPEKKEAIKELLKYWHGKSVREKIFLALPDNLKEAVKDAVFSEDLHLSKGTGHFIVDYEKVLRFGLKKVIEEARGKIESLDIAKNPEDYKKYNFLQAVIIACDAAIAFAGRFAQKAEVMAKEEKDPDRQKELERIAQTCRIVPGNPAGNLQEALQSFWFIQLIPHIDNDGTAISPGRFDRYIYPFYKYDIENKKIDIEAAQELIDCIWVKFNEILQIWPEEDTKYFGGFPISQNLTIGGLDEQRHDITNDISYMCLNATERLRLPQPALSVRIHNNTPGDFLKRVCETIKVGTGMPAVYNDEVIVDSMTNRGIKLSDARNYAIIGCVEPGIPAKGCSWSNAAYVNLAKCLELALNNGKCRLTGEKMGPETGDPLEFKSFQDVLEAYNQQVSYIIKTAIATFNVVEQVHKEFNPLPFKAALVNNCIERGKDVLDGGAYYNFAGPQGVGIANVADSLAAIKKFVFEEKTIGMKELVEGLDADFDGKESLRQMLKNKAPKFGNDDDYVDLLAQEVGRNYCMEVESYKNSRGGSYQPGLYPVSANVPLGAKVGATPDGRKAKAPLADGVSPSQGGDIYGPTAVFKSVAKLDHVMASNGTLLNQKFNPRLLESEQGVLNFTGLLRTMVDLKIMHAQFNVISAETLRKAQSNPKEHMDLVVRVAGYSAFFNELSREIQDDIIARTEQQSF